MSAPVCYDCGADLRSFEPHSRYCASRRVLGPLAVGDIIDLGGRQVRVSGMPDGATLCRDHMKRIAVRNVTTNRLSYIPERRLLSAPRAPKPEALEFAAARVAVRKAEDEEPSYADALAREIEAHTFKRGDDVETPIDAGAAGSQWLRGTVINAGRSTYTVQWVTGAVNRIQQGYKGVRRVELRDILAEDDFSGAEGQ